MEAKAFSRSLLLLSAIILLLLFCPSPILARRHRHRRPRPCKTFSVYLHDVIYDGANLHNFTSAIVGSPAWATRLKLDRKNYFFGDVVVFNDPLTLEENFHSSPVGHGQGLYLYDNMKQFTAWMAFTLAFNSTQHKGTISLMGFDPLLDKKRYLSIVAGSGDFFMTKGIATLTTRKVEGIKYFRIRIDIELYECY